MLNGENMKKRFRLWLTNFGWWHKQGEEYDTLEAAVDVAKEACFMVTVYEDDKPVAFWDPIGGLRRL